MQFLIMLHSPTISTFAKIVSITFYDSPFSHHSEALPKVTWSTNIDRESRASCSGARDIGVRTRNLHRQVDVRLAAPAVRRGVVVVGVVDDGLAALDARAQVELDDVARALLVEEERAVVHHEARAVHAVRQLVGGGGPARHEVLLGGVLGQRVRAVGRPGHVVDLVRGLQGVLAPGARLVVRLEEVFALVDAAKKPRAQEH